jgi:hypothetical protein
VLCNVAVTGLSFIRHDLIPVLLFLDHLVVFFQDHLVHFFHDELVRVVLILRDRFIGAVDYGVGRDVGTFFPGIVAARRSVLAGARCITIAVQVRIADAGPAVRRGRRSGSEVAPVSNPSATSSARKPGPP